MLRQNGEQTQPSAAKKLPVLTTHQPPCLCTPIHKTCTPAAEVKLRRSTPSLPSHQLTESSHLAHSLPPHELAASSSSTPGSPTPASARPEILTGRSPELARIGSALQLQPMWPNPEHSSAARTHLRAGTPEIWTIPGVTSPARGDHKGAGTRYSGLILADRNHYDDHGGPRVSRANFYFYFLRLFLPPCRPCGAVAS